MDDLDRIAKALHEQSPSTSTLQAPAQRRAPKREAAFSPWRMLIFFAAIALIGWTGARYGPGWAVAAIFPVCVLSMALTKSQRVRWAMALTMVGALAGEFTAIGGGWAVIAEPFSEARNEQAILFAVIGWIVGVIIGNIRK